MQETKTKDLFNWTGNLIDSKPAIDVIDKLKSDYAVVDRKLLHSLYSSMLEIILNIKHHAYKADESSDWDIQLEAKENNNFVISVRDFGITIPVSILNVLEEKNIPFIDDSELIHRAIEGNNSREIGRGQGLKSVSRLVSDNIYQSLFIKSRQGELRNSSNGISARHISKEEFKGTLIEISFECRELTK